MSNTRRWLATGLVICSGIQACAASGSAGMSDAKWACEYYREAATEWQATLKGAGIVLDQSLEDKARESASKAASASGKWTALNSDLASFDGVPNSRLDADCAKVS
jgi:hypothetical protein